MSYYLIINTNIRNTEKLNDLIDHLVENEFSFPSQTVGYSINEFNNYTEWFDDNLIQEPYLNCSYVSNTDINKHLITVNEQPVIFYVSRAPSYEMMGQFYKIINDYCIDNKCKLKSIELLKSESENIIYQLKKPSIIRFLIFMTISLIMLSYITNPNIQNSSALLFLNTLLSFFFWMIYSVFSSEHIFETGT